MRKTSARNFFARASRKQWLRGGAYQAVDMYKRMSQASRKGRIFDDVLRHAKLWAEKQTLPSDKFEKKRANPVKQQGLF